MQERNGPNFLTGFIIGSVVGGIAGAVTGILLAPQAGVETRRQLKEKAQEVEEKTKVVYVHARDKTKASVDHLVEEMRPIAAQAKELSAEKQEELRQKTLNMLLEEGESVVKVENVSEKESDVETEGLDRTTAKKRQRSTRRGRPVK